MKSKQHWVITGYDSLTTIYETRVPVSTITQNQMSELLRALVAQAGLSFDEIVGCYLVKNAKGRLSHLEVTTTGEPSFSMTCGSNPYFVARIE